MHLATGVPVVSSDIGGVSEIVTDGVTGYLVEPGAESALVAAIEKAWSDQIKYIAMKQNAKNLISEKFNKSIQFDKFIAHFQMLRPGD